MYTNTADYDVPVTARKISKQKIYAKALFDNIADTTDELAFKRGEILNVIEQDTDGLAGWWLCSLRGRQGICPGNRLRIMNSYDSGCFSLSPSSSPCQSLAASTATLNSSILSSEIYENSSMISSSLQKLNQQNNNNVGSGSSGCSSRCSSYSSNYGQGNRRSWHVSPHKVITPQKCGDVYLYDLVPSSPPPISTPPSSSCRSSQYRSSHHIEESYETYDIPKPAVPINSTTYDIPKNSWCRTSLPLSNNMSPPPLPPSYVRHTSVLETTLPQLQEEAYDVPKAHSHVGFNHQGNMPEFLGTANASSNRTTNASMLDYDIPRPNPIPVKKPYPSPSAVSNFSTTYDFPLPHPKLVENQQMKTMLPQITKELPLELLPALDTLDKLQTEATSSITRLLAFVAPNWRCREKLEPVLMDIKLAVVRLRTALHDLTEFAQGSLGNASKAEDRNLALKLRPLVRALRDADKLIYETSESIELKFWNIDHLGRVDQRVGSPPDSLDQLIACSQTLIEDVRLTASFIQANAPLLFKRIPSTPPSNGGNGYVSNSSCSYSSSNSNNSNTTISSGSSEWLEDYDYVSFESKDATAKKNSELREAIPQNLHKNFDSVVKIAENSAISLDSSHRTELNPSDKLLVKYYAAQIVTHMDGLNEAIESFLETVKKNQPPKFFIAYGKFVVVSAYNLISIGDIVHRNISKAELKVDIEKYTDTLSDALKDCVLKSKKAAQCFPSVTAVQNMVDSVVDISHLANDLKNTMLKVVVNEERGKLE